MRCYGPMYFHRRCLTCSDCMLMTSLLLLLLLHDVSANLLTSENDVADHVVCQSKYFRTRCRSADEVLIVQRARYGRMNLSKCVKENFGYIGCSNDVLDVLDAHCSGRHSCSLRVLDENFMNMKPCHEDLKSYLAVQHTCVNVLAPKSDVCQAAKPIDVTEPRGVLLSIVAVNTGCGSAHSPWRVTVLPGQRINVTLLDFSWAVVDAGTTAAAAAAATGRRVAPAPSSAATGQAAAVAAPMQSAQGAVDDALAAAAFPANCRPYAIVRESSDDGAVTICGGESRSRTVYVSRLNTVLIQFVVDSTSNRNFAFVILYEAIGCPDVEAPPGGWSQRTDRTLLMGCSRSSETWQLYCRDLVWVGQMRNCSPEKLEKLEEDPEFTTVTFPSGILVIIVLAMALFVGLFILVGGVFCLTRQHPRNIHDTRSHKDETRCIVSPHAQHDQLKQSIYSTLPPPPAANGRPAGAPYAGGPAATAVAVARVSCTDPTVGGGAVRTTLADSMEALLLPVGCCWGGGSAGTPTQLRQDESHENSGGHSRAPTAGPPPPAYVMYSTLPPRQPCLENGGSASPSRRRPPPAAADPRCQPSTAFQTDGWPLPEQQAIYVARSSCCGTVAAANYGSCGRSDATGGQPRGIYATVGGGTVVEADLLQTFRATPSATDANAGVDEERRRLCAVERDWQRGDRTSINLATAVILSPGHSVAAFVDAPDGLASSDGI